MPNIIYHPYYIADESPLPLFGEIGGTVIINRVFLVFILFFTLFLISILFENKKKKKKLKKPIQTVVGEVGMLAGAIKVKKKPSNFKPWSLSPKLKTSSTVNFRYPRHHKKAFPEKEINGDF